MRQLQGFANFPYFVDTWELYNNKAHYELSLKLWKLYFHPVQGKSGIYLSQKIEIEGLM